MKDIATRETHLWNGTTYRTILDMTETDGAMSIFDTTSPPRSGPPRHVHDAEDEVLVILSGEIEVWLDGERFICGPGDTAFIPRGAEHTFKVVSDHPSRKIVILTPGGFDRFFAEMASGQFRIPEDMDAINESAGRHNLRFTGPAL